ncbi:hypothetical protein [Micromonospora oryzae]|uniref:hypothetical protein n=1 Tax=Micromonospora sp. DSM 102119 TaxID=3111768 RepID=UPI0031E3DD23
MLHMWDVNLVGLWDSGPYDYGVMEASWICLRGDGTGWSAWANAAGGASLSQLTWICPHEGQVELRYTWTASGTGSPGALPALIEVDEEGPDDTLVRTTFAVSMDTPSIGGPPVMTLHFEESVECSHRYGLLTREADHLLARSCQEQGSPSAP